MLQYEKIDASEGIDVNKASVSKDCMLCNYDVVFKFEEHVCNGCHYLLTMAYSLKNIVILWYFRSLWMGISKNEALKELNNSVTYAREVL